MKAPIVHARSVEDVRARARVARPALPTNATIQQLAEHRAAALRLKDWRLKVSLVSGPTVTRATVDTKSALLEIHAGPNANRDLVRELVGLHFAAFGDKHAARATRVADVIARALVTPSPLPATATRADIRAALLTRRP